MVVTNKIAFIVGAILAVANAAIAFLHSQAILSTTWSVAIAGVVTVLAVFGIQLLSPPAIAQKLPAHVAAAVGAALSALNALLLTLHIPEWVQIVAGALDAAAGALGIVVTGVAISKAAKAIKAKQLSAVDGGDWELSAGALFWLVIVPLSPLIMAFDWVMRNVFGNKSYG